MTGATGMAGGMVEAVTQRDRGYGLRVAACWYDGWGKAPVQQGDQVVVEFAEVQKNGTTYRNVIRAVGDEPAARVDTTMERITSSVALKAACTALSGSKASAGELLQVATQFLEWLQGNTNGSAAGAGNEDEAEASSSAHADYFYEWEEREPDSSGEAACIYCAQPLVCPACRREDDGTYVVID